jgi:glyoxylase-like metal-dependent hydrolase (beta-lactamase superfamily II)
MAIGKIIGTCSSGVLFVVLSYPLAAQAPAKADSAQVKADIAKAEKTAGPMWASEARFFCGRPKGNRPNDPLLEPTKLFDNLYVIGRTGTASYAITTSAGIILIDSGYPNDVDGVLLAGMKQLALDPAQVKIVVITHGHVDHFGGAAYLQEHYGAHVYVSQPDWDLMEHPPARRAGKAPTSPPPVLPKHDMVMAEGQPIVLGDEKISVVAIPGHTPGSMGLIFPVKDQGTTHIAAIFGGTMLGSVLVDPDELLAQYGKSIAHFKDATRRARVDVELQNHPLYDNLPDKLAKLKERKQGGPNPFIVGQANYQRYVGVMGECLEAQVDRRKE